MIGEKTCIHWSQLCDTRLFIQRAQLPWLGRQNILQEKSSLQNAGFETFYLWRRDSELLANYGWWAEGERASRRIWQTAFCHLNDQDRMRGSAKGWGSRPAYSIPHMHHNEQPSSMTWFSSLGGICIPCFSLCWESLNATTNSPALLLKIASSTCPFPENHLVNQRPRQNLSKIPCLSLSPTPSDKIMRGSGLFDKLVPSSRETEARDWRLINAKRHSLMWQWDFDYTNL